MVRATDKLIGLQALERKHPGLPLLPGQVERRELEYIRQGTLTAILNRAVVTGPIMSPTLGPTLVLLS